MGLEHRDVVDAIGTDRKSGNVILTIIDAEDWSDVDAHLQLLQAKLNSYIRFEESGELYVEYPAAKGRRVVIELVARERVPKEAEAFFEKVRQVLASSGIELFRTDEGPASPGR